MYFIKENRQLRRGKVVYEAYRIIKIPGIHGRRKTCKILFLKINFL